MCIHQQDFYDSQHNAVWNHSWTQHKQTSQTPITEKFQMLRFFIRFSLTRDPWTPAGRRKGLPRPPGACLRSQPGILLAEIRARAGTLGADRSLSDGLNPGGSAQVSPGPCRLMSGRCSRMAWKEPPAATGMAARGQTCGDVVFSRDLCLHAGNRPELEVCPSCGLSVSRYTRARTRAPRGQDLKWWLITNTAFAACARAWPPAMLLYVLPLFASWSGSSPPELRLSPGSRLSSQRPAAQRLPSCNAPAVVYSFPWTQSNLKRVNPV